MNIIFQIDGGLGKSILGTAMVKIIKKRYKNSKLIVVTGHPDVFLNNPLVDQVYELHQIGGFYLRYIKDQDCKLFIAEPYKHSDFFATDNQLIRTWCKTFGLSYGGEQPEIFLTKPELEYFSPFYKMDKPILAIHTNGGHKSQSYNYSWTRDIPEPIVLDIINHYKKDYSIVHIKQEKQRVYPNTLQALDGYRSIAILLQLSKKRLLIDSFAQHLSAAMGVKSTVCWVSTKPEVFGYKIHDNILAEPFTKEPQIQNSTYQPFSLAQDISSIPYNNLIV